MANRMKPQPTPKDLPTFTTTLSNGRVVEMRQAIAQDMVYINTLHGDKTEIEQGIYLMAKLATGKEPITIQEIQVLSVKDLTRLGDLVAECTGNSSEVDEDPLEM